MEKNMKITLVQTEIELAIREWVGRQLKVADGMSMDIELAATRAAGVGFTATIDIIPEEKQVSAEPPKTLEALGAVAFREMSNTPKAAFTPKADVPMAGLNKPASEPQAADEGDDLPFDTSENVAGTSVQALESAPTEKQDESPTPVPSASRSLFGSLKKPKN